MHAMSVTTPQGTVTKDTEWTGWNAVGAGYGAVDRGKFALGALVVIPGPVLSAAQMKKLSLWARKWGGVSP
ncbi:hypothetical protein BGE01nite_51170 [Brevifollis gellanilyticus]|uniref:Uncharacterized protein n=2 Tax=Brevifollis gellanilyticus TaxID=748831 RepID=A0A512MGJ4_9BACT|nr:hypothetical protein BGE01nite_51170 [Brevifollis gellanilyticus]